MPEKNRGLTTVPLNKFGVLILGYGYHRNRTDNPWFRRRDFIDAVPEGPDKGSFIPLSSYITRLAQGLDEAGLIAGKPSQPGEHFGRPTAYDLLRVTPVGEDLFLRSLTYSVTHQGETLKQLIAVPEVLQTIIDEGEFVSRVIKQICGETS